MNIFDCFEVAQATVLCVFLLPMIIREIEKNTSISK